MFANYFVRKMALITPGDIELDPMKQFNALEKPCPS
jgi:hypothetical protein